MITTKQIYQECVLLANKYPDAVYRSGGGSGGGALDGCSYSKGTVINGPETCGCLIGQSIRNLDTDLYELVCMTYEGIGIQGVIESLEQTNAGIDTIDSILGISYKCILESIQQRQDAGKKWSECVKVL